MLESSITDPSGCALELLARGFVHLRERHASKAGAWASAREVFTAADQSDAIGSGMPPLEVVGEFTVPPAGASRRDFQILHIDFGLPIQARGPVDVARFTALYIDADHAPTTARTRIVPLRPFLMQRAWSDRGTLLARFRRYGTTGQEAGYVEGILARLVEAADDCSRLPSTSGRNFLCGLEFASIQDERTHFSGHSLELDAVEHRIPLGAGELLLFDNLMTAHGRVGTREPEELQQLCVGYRGLDLAGQRAVLHRVLAAFRSADG